MRARQCALDAEGPHDDLRRNPSEPKAPRRFTAALGAAVVAASLGAASCAPDKMPFKEDETHVFAGG